ncbi:hypothetical protein TorRG33x02_317520, partial [Trema orientale]
VKRLKHCRVLVLLLLVLSCKVVYIQTYLETFDSNLRTRDLVWVSTYFLNYYVTSEWLFLGDVA